MQLLVSGAGLVVTELTLHSDNQSLNPVKSPVSVNLLLKESTKYRKEGLSCFRSKASVTFFLLI